MSHNTKKMSEYLGLGELTPPTRLMMTPGPTSIDPRVYRALGSPLVGHMDPWLTGMLIEEVQVLLRKAFQTQNRITFPISASGSGGIEAAVVNALEPGDEAVVAVNGAFSERMAIASGSRTGATIHRVEAPLGRAVDPEDVRRFAKSLGRKLKFIGVCHGETSTGVLTQIDPFRKVADEIGALLIVDAVATLCGVPLDIDRQHIDLCFAATQKAISAPPGMAPITVGPRMEEVLRNRKTPVQSWYFDLTTTMNFWGTERTYHHTPPIPIIYALREALRLIFEEGLEASWERHLSESREALIAGLDAMGIELFVPNPADRLPTVTSVHVPAGLEGLLSVRRQLLDEFGIEIAGGVGGMKGKIWRVGLMGYVSQAKNILFFLAAFEKVLLERGYHVGPGAGSSRCGAALFTDRGGRGPRAQEVARLLHIETAGQIAMSGDGGSSPAIPNLLNLPGRGPMSAFLDPFDVTSKLTDEAFHVRFSHLWNAIATRHRDTIDAKFFVDGTGAVVELAHTGLRFFAERQKRILQRSRSKLHRRRISSRAPRAGRQKRPRSMTCPKKK